MERLRLNCRFSKIALLAVEEDLPEPELGTNLWAECRTSTKGLTWGSRLQGADAAFLG